MRKLLILLGITVCLMSATPVVTDQKRVLWEDLDTIYMLAGKGRYDTAMIMANNLLPIAIEHHQRQVVVLLLNTIGTGYRYRDMDEQALKVFKLAEDCINELSPEELLQLEETPHIINIYINLAEVYKDLKKKDESLRYAIIAASKTEKKNDSYVRGMVFPLVGGILLEYGKTKEAERYLKSGYQEAIAAHRPGNALIAASHLMTIEAGDNQNRLENSRWKKKADQLLPQVKDEYPRGIYYTALSHLHLAAGELKESKDAIDEAMKLKIFQCDLDAPAEESVGEKKQYQVYQAFNRHFSNSSVFRIYTLVCFAVIIFSILTANMGGFYFIYQNKQPFLPVIELYRAPTVAALPKTVMMPAAVRRFIVDQQHVFLQAVHLRFHSGMDILLTHMPDDLLIQLFKRKSGFHHQVKF